MASRRHVRDQYEHLRPVPLAQQRMSSSSPTFLERFGALSCWPPPRSHRRDFRPPGPHKRCHGSCCGHLFVGGSEGVVAPPRERV
eukprot:9250057-Alexandrium_andersonii.AAC.1